MQINRLFKFVIFTLTMSTFISTTLDDGIYIDHFKSKNAVLDKNQVFYLKKRIIIFFPNLKIHPGSNLDRLTLLRVSCLNIFKKWNENTVAIDLIGSVKIEWYDLKSSRRNENYFQIWKILQTDLNFFSNLDITLTFKCFFSIFLF